MYDATTRREWRWFTSGSRLDNNGLAVDGRAIVHDAFVGIQSRVAGRHVNIAQTRAVPGAERLP
jgi:hypothetical protein